MATKELHFTKRSIEALDPPASGRDTYKDDVAPGLRLRVTAAGSRTFCLVRKAQGRTRWVTLGRFPTMTVAQARAAAGERTAALARGENLAKPKPDRMTFAALFARYLEEHAKPHKRTWKQDQANFDRYLSTLGRRPVVDIDRAMVTQLHARLGKKSGKYTANRVLALLRKVWNFARDTAGMDVDNPCQGVKPFREQSRARFLDQNELQAFFEALKETPPKWRDFFSLCLYTGARRANVAAMKWADLDLDGGIWRISHEEAKGGEGLDVVLSQPAREILRRRDAESEGSPFVFPANSRSGHVEEPKKPWRALLKRAELQDVRLHDLRRTLGSWQAASGASLSVIGKTLGHRNQSTTAIYARLNLDPVRDAVDAATAAMQQAIGGNDDE